mgnify:FL=1
MKHILELLDRTVRRWGSRPAFGDEHITLTWDEVDAAVQRVGTALAQYSVQRRPVALYLDHEVPCLLAMLGTLAAGGFYTVLDTAQPPERVRRITGQLEPALLVTDAAHREAADALGLACPVVEMADALNAVPDSFALQTLRNESLDTDLAYVLFTSGSTGAPKGVAIQHRAVLAYSAWAAATFGIDETTVFGNQTPFYFSMSVTDLYTSLRTGAQVQVLPRRLFSFPVQLLDYLTVHEVNTLYWVPSALGGVVRWKALDYTALPPLRTILFAGETMPTPYLNYWQAHYPGALFANLFGPTETTDICAYYIVDRAFSDDEPLPIGRACDNCGLLVLTDDGRAAEHGAVGELCVRGSFLAAGYYNMPDKTAERFCPNPLQPHYPEIIYRTGDLVRYDENGLLQYMGRADNQIKHMGYRIELGEIETAAFGQEGLQSCACIYDAPKDRLVLFFTGRKGLEEDLRVRLAGRLPAYMQPTAYRRLQAMPQNQNGKIDRAALRALCKED